MPPKKSRILVQNRLTRQFGFVMTHPNHLSVATQISFPVSNLGVQRGARERRKADEFDLTVSNLAVDLRDGVRLMRLMEVLTGEWGLASVVRMPAVSRLQVRELPADGT